MTDIDTATRDRLAMLVDSIPVDVEARLDRVTTAAAPRQPRRWPVVAGALAVAAAAVAFLSWTFARQIQVTPAAERKNGRIAFVDHAPGYKPPSRPGPPHLVDLDIYTMRADGTDVRRLTSGGAIDYAVSWSPDGKRLALVRGGEGPANVFVVSGTGTGLTQITFCRYSGCIQRAAWSPRGDWIAYLRGRDLYLIRPDGTGNHLVGRCPHCVWEGLSWSPDGSMIALGSTGYPGSEIGGLVTLQVGDPAATGLRSARAITFCNLRRILCEGNERDIDPSWSPDGAWIAFTRGIRIWLVRPDGTAAHRLAGCALAPFRNTTQCRARTPVWSPDGARIAFDGAPGIFVMRADGTEVVRIRKSGSLGAWQTILASSTASPSTALGSPNGELVFERIHSCGFGLCSGPMDASIVVARPDGSDARKIGRGTEPAPSPDGTRIAFKGLDGDLYVVRADGSGVQRIFDCRGPTCHGIDLPRWSPDGTRITFGGAMLRDGAMRREIYVVNADGSGLRRLTRCVRPACASHTNPAWSPDGSSVAYLAINVRRQNPDQYGADIEIVDLASGHARTLYRCPLKLCNSEGGIDWSPDGQAVAFGLGSGLWEINGDGSGLRQLTSGQDSDPSWSPDGRLIAFVRYPDRSTGGVYLLHVGSGRVTPVAAGGSSRWNYLFPSWHPPSS